MAGAVQAGALVRKPAGFDGVPYYRMYLIFLLALILTFNGLDRTAIGLVMPSIKKALDLTDTELGVLTGIAFTGFYSTVGILLGRWADRGDRVSIIALTTVLWGLMVMLVGAARSFAELLIVRVGVAVGEAGCLPAAYSLIGDYFEREGRPRAIATYLLGGSASIVLGYLAAGWLSYHYGWRAMFVCIGIPSVIVAPLAWYTLSEPRRKRRPTSHTQLPNAGSLGAVEVIQILWGTRTYRYLVAMMALNFFFGIGILVWQPSFFIRSYGVSIERLGLYLSLVYGVGGLIGTYCGGYLASRYAPKNERLQLRSYALVIAGFGFVSACVYLAERASVSLALLGVAVVGGGLGNGPVFAVAQTVIPQRARAISISVLYLFANLVGAGVGPLVVGALSDALRPYFGVESLRYALLAMCPGYLAGSWLLLQAARSVNADVEAIVVRARESCGITCAEA